MSVLSNSELELYSVYFVRFPTLRNILKIFENFSQPAELVGEPDQLVH